MTQGYLAIVLHAHLPYVRHPEHDFSLEEKWLYEANTECYLPLLSTMRQLEQENISYSLTISLSPTLLSMWKDPLLQNRYHQYLTRLLQLNQKEIEHTRPDPQFGPLARMYKKRIENTMEQMNQYGWDITQGFARLADFGHVELITTAATHGFLPLLNLQPAAVYGQIRTGIDYFKEVFGFYPRGFWLPECGYYPGIENPLAELGIEYFILDTHGLLYAAPRPKYGVYSPIITPSGAAAFARDPESSKQVWSSQEGYPGDYNYREFYRDIGYDREMEYIGPFLHPPGLRGDTGLKYYRITGESEYKEPYRQDIALTKAAEHAGNFMFNREKQAEYLVELLDRPPIVIAPYDAELFGHWWFEGPEWLGGLCRKIHREQNNLKMITPGKYLDLGMSIQLARPAASSWGDKGYYEVWLNQNNDWLYRHLHPAAEKMQTLAARFPDAKENLRLALNQAARELLLAQSSDWPFIMTTGTMDDYARRRAVTHLTRFLKLSAEIETGDLDINWLHSLAAADNLFPNIDYHQYLPEGTYELYPEPAVL